MGKRISLKLVCGVGGDLFLSRRLSEVCVHSDYILRLVGSEINNVRKVFLPAGGHLQPWCRYQPVVALSSGDAEVYSGVCGLANEGRVLECSDGARG